MGELRFNPKQPGSRTATSGWFCNGWKKSIHHFKEMQPPLAHVLIRVETLKRYTNLGNAFPPKVYNTHFYILSLTVVNEEVKQMELNSSPVGWLSVMGLCWGLWVTWHVCLSRSKTSLPKLICPHLPPPTSFQSVGSTPHALWFLLASGEFCCLLPTFSLIKTPSPEGICEMRSVPANSL